MDAWTGFDPFTDEYDDRKIQRNIIALTVQMLIDIDGQLEDLFFPVYAYVGFNLGEEQKGQMKKILSKIVFDDCENGELYREKELKKNVCWMYSKDDKTSINKNIIFFEIENGICMVDLWHMRVNLWLEDVSVNACIGVDYLAQEGLQMTKAPCKLYYKGILIQTRYVEESGNLLEYIDIQGGRRGRKLIQLNRNGLTKEGEEYVDTIIVPKIYSSLLKVLETLARQEFAGSKKDMRLEMAEKIKENMELALKDEQIIWQRQLAGVSLYYNFFMRKYENNSAAYLSKKSQNEKRQWEDAIRHVEEEVRKMQEISGTVQAIKLYASLNKTGSEFSVLDVVNISIADFYDRSNKFAVVSKRRDKGDKWINSLIWLKSAKVDVVPEDGVKILKPKLTEVLEESAAENIQWEDREKNLEIWASFILDNIGSIIEFQSVQQSDLVLELLQSVSIRACFVDAAGNLKVHILTGQSSGGVFYNINAKYRLLKKMYERNSQTHAKRFAGNVWMGYESLQVDRIQEDVCNIKEHYIGQNQDFMLMPCSGKAVTELVQFAENAKKDDGNEKYILIKDQLMKIAELLDACLRFDYNEVKDKELFDSQHSEYCINEQKVIRKEAFAIQLRRGYSNLVEVKFNERQRENKEIVKMKGDELPSKEEIESMQEKSILDRMKRIWFTPERISQLQEAITLGILENAQHIANGEGHVSSRENAKLHEHLEELIGQCYWWKYVWDYFEKLQMEQNMDRIQQCFWLNSSERHNLITWTVKWSNNSSADIIEEYYDNIWNGFKSVIEYHRKELLFQNHQFNFLDLLDM